MFRSLMFVLLSYFHLAIVFSSFFNLRIRIATLVSSNFSVDYYYIFYLHKVFQYILGYTGIGMYQL